MKHIKLIKLTLKDFQGGTGEIIADGEDLFIFASNGKGKTRLVSAFSWLMFNKDALGRSDFSIKNLDINGEAAHGLEHTVIAELDINGEICTLQKTLKEKWVKQRGRAIAEFSGHTVDYWANKVPVKEKEYKDKITDIIGDEETFRLLTSPTTFAGLHWQKQRSILLDIVGDITDQDVIESDIKLAELPGILGNKKLDDYKKIITARKTEINKQIESLPIRIDEVWRGLPDITGLNKKQIEKDIVTTEAILNDIKLKMQGFKTGGKIAEIGNEIASLNIKIRQLESDHYSDAIKDVQSIGQKISEISSNIAKAERNTQDIKDQIKRKIGYADSLEKQLADLRQKWQEVDAEEFQDTTEAKCSACGQALPIDKVQDARDRALASFNQSKAERLTKITDEGTRLRSDLDRLKTDIQLLEAEALKAYGETEKQREGLPGLQTEHNNIKRTAEDYSGIPARAEILTRKAELERSLNAEQEGVSFNVEALKSDLIRHEGEISILKTDLDKFARREVGEKRIEELKAQEKELTREYERIEKELFLCELFIKTKVSLLTGKINSQFEFTQFKLFSVLINGGIEETCKITSGGIGYNSGLNNARRIQAGCDIIRTLQKHYGIGVPIFIDNRESVSEIPSMECQVISLIVSADDPVLRIEKSIEAVAV